MEEEAYKKIYNMEDLKEIKNGERASIHMLYGNKTGVLVFCKQIFKEEHPVVFSRGVLGSNHVCATACFPNEEGNFINSSQAYDIYHHIESKEGRLINEILKEREL